MKIMYSRRKVNKFILINSLLQNGVLCVIIKKKRKGIDMDIKAKIEELVNKIKSDDKLMEKFQNDPVTTVEELAGVDLPNDQVEKVIDGIKAKISLDSIGDKLGGLFGKK